MPDKITDDVPPSTKSASSNYASDGPDNKHPVELATITGLATAESQRKESALGDYVLRILRIRKGPQKENYDIDAVRASPRTRRCGALY